MIFKKLKWKNMLAFTLTLLISLGGAFPAYAATVKNNDIIDNDAVAAVASVENYENWLKNNVSIDENGIEKFKGLNREQKAEFINYLNDPELLINALSTSLEPGESKNLANGDIVVILNETVEPVNTSLQQYSLSTMDTIQYRKATYTKDVTFFGITVLQVTSWIRYSHDGVDILAIQGSSHYTSINYNPLLSSEWTDPVTWIDGEYAKSAADVTFGAFIEGYGIKYGSGESVVWGSVSNNAGGWVSGY